MSPADSPESQNVLLEVGQNIAIYAFPTAGSSFISFRVHSTSYLPSLLSIFLVLRVANAEGTRVDRQNLIGYPGRIERERERVWPVAVGVRLGNG